jgi:hypothetical protein
MCAIFVLPPLSAEEAYGENGKPGRIEEVRVLDLYAGIPVLDAGKREGVLTGDEFTAVTKGANGEAATGKQKRVTIRAVVRRTHAHVSELTVLSGAGKLAEGTVLRRVPRIGVETALYARYTQPSLGDVTIEGKEDEAGGVCSTGARVTLSRGLYSMRPFIGAEYMSTPEAARPSGYSPVRIYGGGELNWYFRRLRVSPSVGAGTTLDLSQYGGLCQVQFSYLLFSNLRVFIELGGAAWKSTVEDAADEIGPFAGVGMSVKG